MGYAVGADIPMVEATAPMTNFSGLVTRFIIPTTSVDGSVARATILETSVEGLITKVVVLATSASSSMVETPF